MRPAAPSASPIAPALVALVALVALLPVAAMAGDAPSSGPCASARLPDRGPLREERERIAAVDADLRARNEALQLRGGTLDVHDMAAVEAYDRDVAALRADAEANDRAWAAYEARQARAHQAAREAVRCGRVAVGGRPGSAPREAAGPAASSGR